MLIILRNSHEDHHTTKEILKKAGLSRLFDSFKEQCIDRETLFRASDSDLIALGVITIGDRIRLEIVA